MTRADAVLPEGFAVRLHDDVEVGDFLTCGSRVVRISAAARDVLDGREVVVTSSASARLATQLLDLDLADPVLDRTGPPGLVDLTVVVPVRDNAVGVDRLLACLGGRVDVIVVDDGSRDAAELAAVVTRHGASSTRLDHNLGPAAARNVGLRQVKTPFVAFVDSDVELSVGCLHHLCAHFADPGLAAVAPRVRSVGGRGWLGRYESGCGSLDLGPVSATTRPWSPVAYVPSACLVARVGLLGRGFDPVLRSGEDVDLVWRLQDLGHRVRYAAEVEVAHDVRPTVRSWLSRKAFYGSSAAPLAARHGDRVAPAALTPSAAVAVAGLLLGRRWSLAAASVGAALTIRQTWSAVPELRPAGRLRVVRGTASALARQTSGLMLRHWSPLTLVLSLLSRRARRIGVALAVADTVMAHRAARPDLDWVRYGVVRRSEHLAYGLGVWAGAARARSAACLVPRWLPSSAPVRR